MTIDIVFGRKFTKSGDSPIEFRITQNRTQNYISSGVRVKRNEWKFGGVVNRHDADILNERLTVLHTILNKEINNRIKDGLPIIVAELREILRRKHINQTNDMYDWFEMQIPSMRLQEGTRSHYSTLLLRLREFEKMLHWHELTVENIYQFDAWLHQLKNKKNEPISNGGVFTYHKCLKALLARAERFGVIERNPYHRLVGQFPRGDNAEIEYLTEAEMAAVESIRPAAGTPMAKARDLFVFQMYTGLAYADTQEFSIDDYENVNGQWVKRDRRVKTGVPYVNQLLPPAVEVLKRNRMALPHLNNAKYNELLKYIGECAGLRKRLTSHMARHTFATWALHHGVPIEIVSRMLGHTNISMTQRYAKVLAEDVTSQFTKLQNAITQKSEF